MKDINRVHIRFILTLSIMVLAVMKINCQTTMPDELNKNKLIEQLNYIETKTRIYENYRAIREDMFQKLKGNISDTVSSARDKIAVLNNTVSALIYTIDSLNVTLKSTRNSLEEMTNTKNSIEVFGLEIGKSFYNTITWTIIIALVSILAFGFLAFKRNLSVTTNTRKDLAELKNEFEAYRKSSREAREKMSMEHFNEIKKLKGK